MSNLSLNSFPEYRQSSFRYFEKHEKHITRINHDDILVMIFDGTLRLHENGIPVEIKTGEYYIERRDIFQEGIEESDEPQYYYIHFFGDFNSKKDGLPIHGKADVPALIPLFHEIELLKAIHAPMIAINSVFYKILYELSKPTTPSPQQIIVQNVMSYVLQDFKNPISMDEISAAVGYCKNHINNVFKKETGMSAQAYITNHRIDAAKQYLLNSERTLEQISKECGFGNYINFYKSFVKKEKISPTDWKHKHQNIT